MEQWFKGDFPARKIDVKDIGEMEVIRYISRVDIYPTATKKRQTHGWQVRYQRISKYFGDGDGSPLDSLAKAEHYLRSIYVVSPAVLTQSERPQKRNKLDIPGVRITTLKRSAQKLADGSVRERTSRQVYIEATHPFKGMKSQRFYVGTEGSYSEEKMTASMHKAIAYRKEAERTFRAFRAEVPPWSPLSTVENFLKFVEKMKG